MELEVPSWRSWDERLARNHAHVRFDPRGTGLSERNLADLAFDHFLLDLEAVVDRLGLDTFALFGHHLTAQVAIAYAAYHPDRVSHLILWCGFARPEYLFGGRTGALRSLIEDDWEAYTETFAHWACGWSEGGEARRLAAVLRECVTPQIAQSLWDLGEQVDVTDLLPNVRAPTLVMQRREYAIVSLDATRELASNIPNAQLCLLEGSSGATYIGNMEAVAQAIDEFLGEGKKAAPVAEPGAPGAFRTILFTDIEGSTAMTQRLGDAKAREVLREHERIVREALKAHGGSEVKTMGDGFMASFGSATKALECAIVMQRAFAERNASLPAHPEALEGRAEPHPLAHPFDSAQDRASTGSARADRGVGASPTGEAIRVRIGLNAGEPIAEDDPDGRGDLFGTAVIRAARIAALAQGGEILVANVVRELAEGKGFLFGDRGEVALRGFDDPVRVFEVRWRE